MAETNKTSPWVWVAVGCGGFLLVCVLGAVGLGFLGFRWAKGLEATLKDPVARTDKVTGILGCEELPEGYYAMVGMSIPFVMDLAVLTDVEPVDGEEPHDIDERSFIYLEMLSFGKQSQELRDYFEGKTDNASVLRQNNINIRVDEIIKRGTIDRPNGNLLYLVQRGSLDAFGTDLDGYTAMILIDCPGDRRTRMGFWSGPDPSADRTGASAEELTAGDLAGSPADEQAIRDFLSGFELCPAP